MRFKNLCVLTWMLCSVLNYSSSLRISMAITPRRSARLQKNAVSSSHSTEPLVEKIETKVKKTKCLPSLRENHYRKLGFDTVIGVDEAGRGPLAGPVVVAACSLSRESDASIVCGVNDSKCLSEKERERLYELLISNPGIKWSVSVTTSQRIDEINILQATMESMKTSAHNVLQKCSSKKSVILIDGNRIPEGMETECEFVIKGDSREYCIAAASIIAKVTRDRLMMSYHENFPQYGFDRHKGYGTLAHMKAIAKHGPCEIHRMTFRPLKKDD